MASEQMKKDVVAAVTYYQPDKEVDEEAAEKVANYLEQVGYRSESQIFDLYWMAMTLLHNFKEVK